MNPKKALLGFVALIAAVALLIVGGGMMIDGAIAIGTEKELAAPPAAIWPFLDNADGLERWWKMTVEKVSGPDSGPGLKVRFERDDQTLEHWTIKEADPPNRIVYDVEFVGMMTIERTLTLTPSGSGTKVVWRETGNIENPLMRWGKVAMTPDGVIAGFDRALVALDAVATSTVP